MEQKWKRPIAGQGGGGRTGVSDVIHLEGGSSRLGSRDPAHKCILRFFSLSELLN